MIDLLVSFYTYVGRASVDWSENKLFKEKSSKIEVSTGVGEKMPHLTSTSNSHKARADCFAVFPAAYAAKALAYGRAPYTDI